MKNKTYIINLNDKNCFKDIDKSFDIIISLGTLYHLSNPEYTIQQLKEKSPRLILETMVTINDDIDTSKYGWNYEKEDITSLNQSANGIGCRPGYKLVDYLLKIYKYVVILNNQPDNSEFITLRRIVYCYDDPLDDIINKNIIKKILHNN